MTALLNAASPYETAHVPLEMLRKSPGNKRAYSETKARRLAATYDEFLAGAIHVVYRDGLYWVVDGWHRSNAARAAGRRSVLAIIAVGYSAQDDARAFDTLNTVRTRITSGDEFWARVDYGHPTAVGVLDVCERLGIEVLQTYASGAPSGSSAKRLNATRAYTALQSVAERHGFDVLELALSAIKSAWPSDPRGLDALTIAYVASFIALYRRHPYWAYTQFTSALTKQSVSTIHQRIKTLDGARGTRDNGVMNWGSRNARDVLVAVYNHGLKRRRLPEATPSDLKRASLGQNPWTEA